MADPKMLRVRLGISEIDSYNMLFYSHYLRYNERAANSCLSPESSSAVLCRVSLAKYMSSVRWNDTVDIRTTAVVEPSAEGQSVQGECTLLHEWFVAEQYEKPAYLSLCTYAVCGPAGFTGARTPDAREARRIQALQREAGVLFTPQVRVRVRLRLGPNPNPSPSPSPNPNPNPSPNTNPNRCSSSRRRAGVAAARPCRCTRT